MDTIAIPEFVFFTGAPGSKWSGVAQAIERLPKINISDRRPGREYKHSEYPGHLGAYFGPQMELADILDLSYLRSAWEADSQGSKIVKSHHWAYKLDEIKQNIVRAWIVLVWRNDADCSKWWHQAGGFNISYPSYAWYENKEKMDREIALQNQKIRAFAGREGVKWSNFDEDWLQDHFGASADVPDTFQDVRVAIYKEHK